MPGRRRYPLYGLQLRPRKRPLNGSISTPAHRFHFFPKLPPELQFMIWDFWRDDQREVRHFIFFLTEGPCYGAFDLRRRTFITDEVPVDPRRVKIDLTVSRYPVIRLNNWNEVAQTLKGDPPLVTTSSPFAWVDFEKDLFFTYDMLPQWWRPRYFAFDVRCSDWWRRIRRLTLCVSDELKQEYYYYLPDELRSVEAIFILRMPRVEKIKHTKYFRFLADETLLSQGFCYPNSSAETRARDRITRSIPDEYRKPVKTAAEQIKSSFHMRNHDIGIKIIWKATKHERF